MSWYGVSQAGHVRETWGNMSDAEIRSNEEHLNVFNQNGITHYSGNWRLTVLANIYQRSSKKAVWINCVPVLY
eukprot:COSAG02_NODE_67814_length_252_cov_0.666667_1_plen_72_part_10